MTDNARRTSKSVSEPFFVDMSTPEGGVVRDGEFVRKVNSRGRASVLYNAMLQLNL